MAHLFRRLTLVAAAIAALLLAASGLALADGGASPGMYGPPPELPAGSADEQDDAPRRDIHMGNVDHMKAGRDSEGNVIMEVRPRPKNPNQQPQAGPFYIYPQIGVPGPMPMGRPTPGMPMGGVPAGQQPAARPGQMGQTGQGWPASGPAQGRTGQSGQSAPSATQWPSGQGNPPAPGVPQGQIGGQGATVAPQPGGNQTQ